MSTKCQQCGVELPLEKQPERKASSFRLSRPVLCAECREIANLRYRKINLWAFIAVTAIIFTEAALVRPDDPAWWLIVNFYLSLWGAQIFTPLHELGHAYAARLIGWKVERIILGFGRPLAKLRLLGFLWEWRLFYGGGVTLAHFTARIPTVTTYGLYVFAGPLANLLIAAVVVLFLPNHAPWRLDPLTHGFAPIPTLFFWGNIFLFVTSMCPQVCYTPMGMLESDGLRLWKLFRHPKSTLINLSLLTCFQHANTVTQTGQLDEARKILAEALKNIPDDKSLTQHHSLLAMEAGDLEAAHAGFNVYKARTDLTPLEEAFACNNLAYLYAVLGDPTNLVKADELSQRAFAALPSLPSVIGTRAAVLITLGRYTEGEALLHASMPKVENPSGYAQNLCWLALAAAKQGRIAEGREKLAEARRRAAYCYLIPRFEKAFPELTDTPSQPSA